jgi:2-oxoisovalerate dehydrogenase E1 component alpha subunit
MYRTMVTARLVEEAAFRLNRQGKAPFVVPVSGHEGCQVGTGWPLRPGQDIWVPYYRDVAIVLIAGMTPYEIFLGLFAKADDPSSGGRQMPSHWGSRRLGIISHSSPIATQVPHAAGIAYAAKYRGEDAVVGCWFGEGATSAGAWHEGLNFAGIHKLPVVFVCENNQFAESTPVSYHCAATSIADRAASYNIPGVLLDGYDVLAVYEAVGEAVGRARRGEGPSLLEARTWRYFGHFEGDQLTYRTAEQSAAYREHDPLTFFASQAVERGLLTREDVEQADRRAMSTMDAAVAFGEASPHPKPEDALTDVYVTYA